MLDDDGDGDAQDGQHDFDSSEPSCETQGPPAHINLDLNLRI